VDYIIILDAIIFLSRCSLVDSIFSSASGNSTTFIETPSDLLRRKLPAVDVSQCLDPPTFLSRILLTNRHLNQNSNRMGFSLNRQLTYFGNSPRCFSSYSPRAKFEIDLENITQISIQTKSPLSRPIIVPVFFRRFLQSFDYFPEILIVDCRLLIACMNFRRSAFSSRHKLVSPAVVFQAKTPPFEAKI
jgi:hypothetical protein